VAEAEVEVAILNVGDRFRMQKAVGSRQGAKGNYWVSAKVFRAYLAHMERDAVFQELLAKTENERCLRQQLATSQKMYIELAARTIRPPTGDDR